jgi:hypothetical protein
MRWAVLALLLVGCGPSLPGADAIGDCASCHPQQAREFALSRHQSASSSATFAALRARAGSDAPLCDRCHRPDAVAPGLTCLTCHAAYGNQALRNGELLLDPSGPVQVGSAEGLSAPHAVQASGFLQSSDLCATCHDVEGPGAFHEQPFESWQRSPAAQRGLTCQACHLSPTPGQPTPRPVMPVARGARTARPHAHHDFVGLGAGADQVAALLEAGLSLSLQSGGGSPRVTVTNVGQGHHALAGVGFVRQLSVEVVALSADGGAAQVASVPLDVALTRAGAPEVDPLAADAWQDQGLDPGESRVVPLTPPEGAQALQACLSYREVRPELAASLGVEAGLAQQAGCVQLPLP